MRVEQDGVGTVESSRVFYEIERGGLGPQRNPRRAQECARATAGRVQALRGGLVAMELHQRQAEPAAFVAAPVGHRR
jgi:hypothetical protein